MGNDYRQSGGPDDRRNDPIVQFKRLIFWAVIFPVLLFILFANLTYEDPYDNDFQPQPLKGYDPDRDIYDIYGIDPVTLEIIYNDDPRIERKVPIPLDEQPQNRNSNTYYPDFSDPHVIEQIFENNDFYDLYERYAD